ncbi:MAG: non-heme iron oxygenase ferredoxin subunit [Chloroflexaceae bacterium]|nr:non-heme iron oxygenase ferredoxin subunit [Chloroflexaceae bacterium]
MAWVRIANVNEVPEGTGKTFTINNHQIAVFQVEGQFYALDDTCSHAEASLGEGEVDVEERCVECPLHGSLFDLATGQPRTLPAYEPVPTYPVRIEEGMIIVEYSS